MDQLIGPSAAARRMGVSSRTVQRWLRSGDLPAIRVGKRLKVHASALGPWGAPQAGGAIRRLLVANRGELVARITRTCRAEGIACLALVTDDQRDAWWAGQADEAIALTGSYLDGDAILAAAAAAGADAIHPGYGFLAERPDFAEAVIAAGLTWVGPPPAAMRILGDKAAARRLAARLGVPIIPGYDGRGQSDAVFLRQAARIGYPVLLKPRAGGGGKGMHVVQGARDLRTSLAQARREAAAAFGDERLILERCLDRPRHVEIQFLRDGHGGGVHLGERDCSLQRRHQKVVEESPAPGVSATVRDQLGTAALRLVDEAGYVGAGTAEFLLADDGTFVFLELNARLQVEHPVSEAVTGIDLVAAQLRIAAGEPLGFSQAEVRIDGHAVEARIYAEDPWGGFLPATGQIAEVAWPGGPGVRVDAGVGPGDDVGTRYDPLLAKLIAHGRDRAEALARLDGALAETGTLGVTTNRGFLRWLLAVPEVVDGDARTDTIDIRWHPEPPEVPDSAWPIAAAVLGSGSACAGSGFRLNGAPRLPVEIAGERRSVPLMPLATSVGVRCAPADDGAVLDIDGRAVVARIAAPPTVEAALHRIHHPAGAAEAIVAPMPGVVIGVRVAVGEAVEAHQVLLVLEAMKMENAVTAPGDGVVARLRVRPGQAVQRGDMLVELES